MHAGPVSQAVDGTGSTTVQARSVGAVRILLGPAWLTCQLATSGHETLHSCASFCCPPYACGH